MRDYGVKAGRDLMTATKSRRSQSWPGTWAVTNFFGSYSEKASSERMRNLWAAVLAGEIRKPQSFSLTTLRFLSELDKEIAEIFETETKHWMDDGCILKPKHTLMRGEKLLRLTFLEEVGLLQGVHGSIKRTNKPNEDGYQYWKEGNFLLQVKSRDALDVNIIKITRIGIEILSILPPKNDQAVLEDIADLFYDSIQSAQIFRIHSENPDGTTSARLVKTIKADDEE